VKACLPPGGELIVCDNNSTDATPRIAEEEGAAVVFEPHNQISRARNAGARAAAGDWLLFIDADSVLHPGTLEDLLLCAKAGRVVGGGCLVALDRVPKRYIPVVESWNLCSRFFRVAAGSFVFCRADAFREVGGFSEELYAGEELELSRALKRWGRRKGLDFVILTRHPHVSSGRKAYLYTGREMLGILWRALSSPLRVLRAREMLPLFYDGRR
jgi:glycosyltransferase involved in cell wall biosynthesis